ncbi:MAG: inositol monophosphatase [Phycisphaeraceae bacterium]|nr:hypothetical protein [Phycisphaerales bacterium]MCB9859798.1 inositol monophosphatase [Phycisphaeraceae bacterium]
MFSAAETTGSKQTQGAPLKDDLAARLEHATQIARESAQITLEHFQTDVSIQVKKDGSPVTVADRECEKFLRQRILTKFAKDGVLGEEHPETFGASGYRWVIDPIDGTRSFIHGVPLWGTMIGVEKAFPDGTSSVVAGVIFMPALNEMIWAADGHGAWHRAVSPEAMRARALGTPVDDEYQTLPARVSDTKHLKDATVCLTSVRGMHNAGWDVVHVELGLKTRAVRGWSDCYSHLLLCTGRIDAVLEPVVSAWDVAATVPILREAGGKFTHPSGFPEEDAHQPQSIASNGHLHQELVELVQEYRMRD